MDIVGGFCPGFSGTTVPHLPRVLLVVVWVPEGVVWND